MSAGQGRVGRVEVLNGERVLGMNERHNPLVGRSLGQLRQLVAGFLLNADPGLAAESDKSLQALVMPLAGHQNVVKAPSASLHGFFNRMQSVKNFHSG
jgi:hypothetical protein